MTHFMVTLGAVAALTVAAPALAQGPAGTTSVAAGESASAQTAPDPERLAAASRVVDRIWPIGTFRRVMASTMDSTTAMLAGTVDAAAIPWEGDDKISRRAQHEARTGRPLASQSEADAAAATAASEAAEAGLRRMNEALIPVFERIEPNIRTALARVYARRYSLTELAELDAFFATPTGMRYASDSLTIMNDPEMTATMATVMEDAMAAIIQGAADAATEAAADAATAMTAVSAAAKY